MAQSTKTTRQNRTLTVDFQDSSTYCELISDGKAFVEFVLAFILSIGCQLAHKATCTGGCLTSHSHYARIRLAGLTIWRIQCTSCRAVFTVLPHFALRYRSMSPDVAVAYPAVADKCLGPLTIRLKGCHQLVIRTPKAFSTPHSPRLAGI